MPVNFFRIRFRIVLLFTLIIASFSSSAQEINAGQLSAEIEHIKKDHRLPAIIVAVFTADSILFIDAEGVRKVKENDQVTINDLFHIGSNTKAMTAFIAARLVEEGKLKWNTRFLEVFPALKAAALPAYHNITLEQLLSHQALLKPFTAGKEFLNMPKMEGTISEQRIIFSKEVLKAEPQILTKEKPYNYSNAGFVLAAAMMEQVTGKTWEVLVQEYIANPMNLQIYFGWPGLTDPSAPWGHIVVLGRPSLHDPNGTYKLEHYMAPAGDVSVSMINYIKWLQNNLKGIQGDLTFLPSESWKRIHFTNAGKANYSYGWRNEIINGDTISTHNGSAGTFFAHATINKNDKYGIAIFTNSGIENSSKAIEELRKYIMKAMEE